MAAIETLQITLVYVCRTFSVFDVATLIDDAAARSSCRGGKTRAPANERAAFCFVVGFAARRKRCETSRSSVVRPGRQRLTAPVRFGPVRPGRSRLFATRFAVTPPRSSPEGSVHRFAFVRRPSAMDGDAQQPGRAAAVIER